MPLSNPASRILDNLRARTRALAAAAWPPHCVLCGSATPGAAWCPACAEAVAMPPEVCPSCALPSPGGAICGGCLAHPPAFDATLAVGPYRFPLDRLVTRLKYAGQLPFAAALGERLGATARRTGAEARVDALVPMPLAPVRQRERGANQAREIAREAARIAGLPLSGALRRTRHTAPQASLARRERARSLRGAFVATRPLHGARLALVDDVMTSGATAAAAAAALRRAGASRVEVWVVARSFPA